MAPCSWAVPGKLKYTVVCWLPGELLEAQRLFPRYC
jgi:hypothetical protein